MDVAGAFQALAISLGLGLLVGMQREKVQAPLAGVRTFALITVLGTLAGLLAPYFGPWIVGAGLLGVAAATAVGNLMNAQRGRGDAGITTEIAALAMYVVGAYLVIGQPSVAVVVGGGVAVLLHAKPEMHGVVRRLGEADMRAIMQFVLLTLVILPILPDERYGPFEVFNLREIWWMVVLVVGISLLGYVALKLGSGTVGILLGGIIGGLISSTATTVSYSRRAAGARTQLAAATLVILLASAIVYGRVLVEIAVVAPGILAAAGPPIAAQLALAIALSAVYWWKHRRLRTELPPSSNPTELRSALVFGAIYAAVLLAIAWARDLLGDRGIYVVAAVSGLTDMDAITLSTSRLAARGAAPVETVWRAILVAAISNLVAKGAIVGALGGGALLRQVGLLFAVQVAGALALLLLWPA